jgi:hypothetical protein
MTIAVTKTKAVHRAGATVPAASQNPRQYVTGELPLPTFTGTGSGASINWNDNGAGGSFAPATTANGQATTYTPANQDTVVTVTGVDSSSGLNRGSTTIKIEATLPLNPVMGYDTDTDQDTQASESKDKTRVVATFGPLFDTTPLQWLGRHKEQWLMMRAFWNFHKKVKMFWFVDQETGEMYRVWFDSPLRQSKRGANQFDMSATVKGPR